MDDLSSSNHYETSSELDVAERLLKIFAPASSDFDEKCTTSAKEKENCSECLSGRYPRFVASQSNSELPTIHSLTINSEIKESINTGTSNKFDSNYNPYQPRFTGSAYRFNPLKKPGTVKYCAEEDGNEHKRVKLIESKESIAQGYNETLNFSASSSIKTCQPNSRSQALRDTQYSSKCLKSNIENSSDCELAEDALQCESVVSSKGPPTVKGNVKVPDNNSGHKMKVEAKHKITETENRSGDDWACVVSNEYFSVGLDDCLLRSDTLREALELLELPCLLDLLDEDLEKVRANSKNKADHEIYFNQCVNKPFKKLSAKFHPDSVIRRGGTNEDVVMATEMQKSLNSVWSILKNLHKNFINDDFLGDEEFKYSTCSNVEVNTLNNEERLKNINNRIFVELSWLTRIKHEEIIPYFNKFMEHSESSLQHFVSGNDRNFAQSKQEAVLYFHMCMSGYEKLVDALRSLFKDCCEDKELSYIKSSTKKMLDDTSKQLEVLKRLKKNLDFTKLHNLKNSCNLAERDFVLPFVEYLYLLSMCSCILKSDGKKWLSRKWRQAKNVGSGFVYFLTKSNPAPYSDSSGSDDDEGGDQLDVIRIIEKNTDLINSCFLQCCVKYLSQNDKASKSMAIHVLETLGIPCEGFNRKVAKASVKDMILKRVDNLKKQFRPIKASKMYTMGQCMRDIKNLMGMFQSEFEEAAKEIEEIKEERRKNAEESRKRNEDLQNEIKELEEKEKRLRALLEKVTQSAVGSALTPAE